MPKKTEYWPLLVSLIRELVSLKKVAFLFVYGVYLQDNHEFTILKWGKYLWWYNFYGFSNEQSELIFMLSLCWLFTGITTHLKTRYQVSFTLYFYCIAFWQFDIFGLHIFIKPESLTLMDGWKSLQSLSLPDCSWQGLLYAY